MIWTTMVPEVELDKLQTRGNRQNIFLAGAILAGYRALLEEGVEPEHAIKLVSGMGWKVYATCGVICDKERR